MGFVAHQINEIEIPIVYSQPITVNHELTIEEKIRQYDWDPEIAEAIMMAESRGYPDVINWNDKHHTCVGSFGLFQVACFWFDTEDTTARLDPDTNIELAYNIYKENGWEPWTTYTRGYYRKYLP